jgi:hypothetical protein
VQLPDCKETAAERQRKTPDYFARSVETAAALFRSPTDPWFFLGEFRGFFEELLGIGIRHSHRAFFFSFGA